MKIAISSNDGRLNSQISARFGRCKYFIFIDTETKDWEAKLNPAESTHGGAGAQVVQFLSDNNVEATITGRYGPTAFSALKAAGIQAFQAPKGTPEELMGKLTAGELELALEATSQRHF
jgi:predicted Fe-Mo cluster-binding NifX family protein